MPFRRVNALTINKLAPFLLLLAAGCSRPPQPTTASQPTRATDDTVVSVSDMLRQGADTDAWRTYVQQLNHYLAGHPNAEPRRLSKEEQELFLNQLDKGELAELENTTFTP